MYQPGSLSSLLAPTGDEQTKKQKKQKQEDVPTSSSTGGLSKLFSDSSLQKFARVLKPEEFGAVRKKKEVVDDDDNGKDAKKAAKGPKKREGKKAKWDDAKRKERDEKKGSSGSVASSSSVPSISDIKSDKKEKKRKAAEALDNDTNTTTKDSKGSESTVKKSKTNDKAVEAETETETEQINNAVVHDTSKDHLTAFFGNVPISETVKSIKKYCTQFGEVESVRLRSVPIAGTAVDDAGNQNLVRKVCANSRNFMEIKGSFNAYVVFTTEDAVTNSLRANNQLWGTRHLRVDRMKPTLFDPSRSVFVGSLPHYADEEDIRNHFAKVLPNGHADIEGIRLVRDPETLIGKGIGYLLFRDKDAVMKALSLHEQMFKKIRTLRVTTCGKRTKSMKSKSPEGGHNKEGDSLEGGEPKSKKKKGPKQSPTAVNAIHRIRNKINLKSANTRNKALVAKKQKKSVPGKKGKRLGGVVKRAMKASSSKKK